METSGKMETRSAKKVEEIGVKRNKWNISTGFLPLESVLRQGGSMSKILLYIRMYLRCLLQVCHLPENVFHQLEILPLKIISCLNNFFLHQLTSQSLS